MSRRPRPTLASLKAEVWAELRRGEDIIEATLETATTPIYGLCEGRTVYINPTPSIVDSVLHELLHRCHPRMSERRVAQLATCIMVRMSRGELRKWAKQYKAVAKKRRKPFDVDAA